MSRKGRNMYVCLAEELTSWPSINSLLTTYKKMNIYHLLVFEQCCRMTWILLFVFVIGIYHICAKGWKVIVSILQVTNKKILYNLTWNCKENAPRLCPYNEDVTILYSNINIMKCKLDIFVDGTGNIIILLLLRTFHK